MRLFIIMTFFSFAAESADLKCDINERTTRKFIGKASIGEFRAIKRDTGTFSLEELSQASIIFFPNTRKQLNGKVTVRYGSSLKNAYLQGVAGGEKFSGIIYTGLGDIRQLQFVDVLTFESSEKVFTLECR
jgi:hypothetical protein